MKDYPPTQAFRCRLSIRITASAEEAFKSDIQTACNVLARFEASGLEAQINNLLNYDNRYNDIHRAILFLGEIVKKRADELAAKLDKGETP